MALSKERSTTSGIADRASSGDLKLIHVDNKNELELIRDSQELDAVWIENSLIQQALLTSTNIRQRAAKMLNHVDERQIFHWINPEPGAGAAAPLEFSSRVRLSYYATSCRYL